MIPNRFRLCELFGIPIYLDFSLVILLVMFATDGGPLFTGLLSALLLLVSITAHELGHSLTARSFGYPTRDITLSLLGGCASLIALPRKASQEFLTAIAGPAVSFLLSFLGVLGLTLCASRGGIGDAFLSVLEMVLGSFGINVGSGAELYISSGMMWLASLLVYFAVMNAMLGLFNLLPGFPMDGGRVFRSAMRAFMPRTRATYIAMVVGRVFAVLLALSALHRILHGTGWGFVTLLIAWMIWREGHREYMQALAEGDWGGGWDFSARVSPPPYGGRGDETEVRRGR
ncbi:MAG: site-2 protease family protein [Kiritimatiellia bacterium]